VKRPLQLITAAACSTLLLACSGQEDLEEAAKKAVLAAQFEELDIEFSNMQHYPGETICGQYGTTDKWGKETSSQHFIVRKGSADTRPSKEDWQIFCTENPASELKALYGIEWGSSSVDKIYADLKSLDTALQEYVADNYKVPSPKQGLPALVSKSKAPPTPMKFREGGYIDSIPTDPWDRAYQYKPSDFGGVASVGEIQTLGSDGVEGGSGENADIGSRHLKYLDHLAKL
jgi:type II secretion system protein G